MNLEESNRIYEQNKQKNAKKRTILGAIIVVVILIILCLIGILYFKSVEAERFKMFVDGKEVNLNSNLIVKDENNDNYVSIKELSQYTGYKYIRGNYVTVNEDKKSCYIENDYEIVTFDAGDLGFSKYGKNEDKDFEIDEENKTNTSRNTTQNTAKNTTQTNTTNTSNSNKQTEEEIKYLVKTKDGEKSIYVAEKPIKMIEDEIYISIEDVKTAFNAIIELGDKYIKIYDLNYLVKYGQAQAAKLGYSTISSTYENLRAISNDMLVVGNDNEYGVVSLENGETILGIRYDDIIYVQNENQFYVTVDSKVGLMNSTGDTIISPKEYDSIETFDVDKKLYLVKKDGKYGILDDKAETIIYPEFDQIGLEEEELEGFIEIEKLSNKNIWFDDIIPVKKGSKYGLCSIKKGGEVLACEYDGFGYKKQTTDISGEESALFIPEDVALEGIVLKLNDLHGIYSVKYLQNIIMCACPRIYSVSRNGNQIFYMEFDGSQLEMKQYFSDHRNEFSSQGIVY